MGYSDIVLAFAAVMIISVMILPLPVVADRRAGRGQHRASARCCCCWRSTSRRRWRSRVFPSVLLITTLFRLALSIATTRSILLQRPTPATSSTPSATLVAGGNLVVGLVVFLIITMVQFIVDRQGRRARGRGRGALHARRDAGQADVDRLRPARRPDRQGRGAPQAPPARDGEPAARRMDGAMKFVKGDAIAGIVIIVHQPARRPGDRRAAARHDARRRDRTRTRILTIGDGLVSQIPALLATIAAGLDRHAHQPARTTTATSATRSRRQISGKPRVLLITGGSGAADDARARLPEAGVRRARRGRC